jgi:hypothetical protein
MSARDQERRSEYGLLLTSLIISLSFISRSIRAGAIKFLEIKAIAMILPPSLPLL